MAPPTPMHAGDEGAAEAQDEQDEQKDGGHARVRSGGTGGYFRLE